MAMAERNGPFTTTAAMRRRYALHLLAQGGNASPVQHPLQAMVRALQGAMGGYYMGQLASEEAERQRIADERQRIADAREQAREERERIKAENDAITRPPRLPYPVPPPDAPPPEGLMPQLPPGLRDAALLLRSM
jgi:hypothetical protein